MRDYNELETFNVTIKRKFFKLPTPWTSIGDGRVIIPKDNLKKIMKGTFIAGNIVMGSIVTCANMGLNALKRMEGADYIVEYFSNNGFVPNELSLTELVSGELGLQYTDANGETQVMTGESVGYLVEEMTETVMTNGWDVSALAVYLEKICGENAPVIPGVDENAINKAKMEAYDLKKFEEKKEEYANKGVLR